VVLFSCNNNNSGKETKLTDNNEKNNEIAEHPIAVNSTECYWQILKRDTLVAMLQQNGNIITGKLNFDNFEKDASSGPVTGMAENNILKLWYSFDSEGMHSVMEVWFKKEGETLLRGTGEMGNKSDTSYFTNPSAVVFTSNQVIKKVDCNEVASKYRN
ncbi:MAG TPA: hypothetical protein VLR49_07495, partial [Ferruginibacter sp.]|nr:hypothetical protein [Ferruginibacter sp.]